MRLPAGIPLKSERVASAGCKQRMAGDEKAAILGATAHQSPAPILPIGNTNEEVAAGTGKKWLSVAVGQFALETAWAEAARVAAGTRLASQVRRISSRRSSTYFLASSRLL